MRRLFPTVEGSWKLYLCSRRNLGGIFGIPAATSEAGEGEQQHKTCSEWGFWWDISGKLAEFTIRKEESADDVNLSSRNGGIRAV